MGVFSQVQELEGPPPPPPHPAPPPPYPLPPFQSKWNEWILEEHVFKCDKEGWELFESNNACVREERAARIAAEKRAKAAGKAGGKEAKKEDNIDKANETVAAPPLSDDAPWGNHVIVSRGATDDPRVPQTGH